MDLVSDVKMLLLLLACLASSCGRSTGLPNQGYSRNVQQQPSSVDKILKAVLVHESTGNGVHSGRAANDSGDNCKQDVYRAGQSASTGYSYSAETGLQNIRVFHKSHGDTGYTQPQFVREAPRGFSTYAGASSRVDPDQALKSIHDSIFRPRPGQSFFGSGKGFRHETPKQSGYFYGSPRQTTSGFAQTLNRGLSANQYASNGPTIKNLLSTGSVGYPSIGYQYASPVRGQKTGSTGVHSNSGPVSAFEGSSNAGSGSFQNGYPFSDFAASAKLSLSEGPKGVNVFHTSPAHAPKPEGSRYEKPVSMGYTYEKSAAADQVAILQFVSSLAQLNSENQAGYRYMKPVPAQSVIPQATYTVNDGYQYTAPPQSLVAPHPSSNINSSLQVDMANQPSNFNNFAPNFVARHYSEKPQTYQSKGYNYDQPNKSDSTKSVFKGQPYLSVPPSAAKDSSYPTAGYRYDKPNESSRPETVFKGQPYLPIPPVSGGL